LPDSSGINYNLPLYNITFIGPHDLDKDLAKLIKNPIRDSDGNSFTDKTVASLNYTEPHNDEGNNQIVNGFVLLNTGNTNFFIILTLIVLFITS
jgi:hypothetical protein